MAKRVKQSLKDPWRRIHGGIWLIGIAVLAWQGWWWPGILVLVALSSILEAVLMLAVPDAFEVLEEKAKSAEEQNEVASAELSSAAAAYPLHLLPSECRQCGAPLRPHTVQWDHPKAAHCPYCGVLLPLAEAEG
ncbi:MAG: hypothetical protein RML93_10040 [Anaerolineales bacterium]|nr:hypothetical protein [Anaerolineales bacterium]MCS7248299.1 hypothetical protein [Anaerolineales bacterium]MDW8162113.1 hypothetical protein [Anaerolineales bacterium]MDW8447617.1 hypothetical protein [Anaerolineales bacterium]